MALCSNARYACLQVSAWSNVLIAYNFSNAHELSTECGCTCQSVRKWEMKNYKQPKKKQKEKHFMNHTNSTSFSLPAKGAVCSIFCVIPFQSFFVIATNPHAACGLHFKVKNGSGEMQIFYLQLSVHMTLVSTRV